MEIGSRGDGLLGLCLLFGPAELVFFFFGWVGGVGLKAVESLLVATGVTALIRLGE